MRISDWSSDVCSSDLQALREMPLLEAAIKEALRLHPPLILLLRVAQVDIDVAGHRIPAGTMVGASPSVSNRLPEVFDDAEAFDPSRYVIPRETTVPTPGTGSPSEPVAPPASGRASRE